MKRKFKKICEAQSKEINLGDLEQKLMSDSFFQPVHHVFFSVTGVSPIMFPSGIHSRAMREMKGEIEINGEGDGCDNEVDVTDRERSE